MKTTWHSYWLVAIFSSIVSIANAAVVLDLGTTFTPDGVSGDGAVVAGTLRTSILNPQAVRWTLADGFLSLGDLPGGHSDNYGQDISNDASTIVGYGGSSNSGSVFEAFRWSAQTGIVGLGDFPGGEFDSGSVAVSSDGSVIAGVGYTAIGSEAFRWTESSGLNPLGFLPGTLDSSAVGISADGSTIVGRSGKRPFRWTQSSGMIELTTQAVIASSPAYDVSADGSVVVGGLSGSPNRGPFRWTPGAGMVMLDRLGFASGTAFAVSDDGSLVVGSLTSSSNPDGIAFIWDDTHGTRRLQDVLANEFHLGSLLNNWVLTKATGISADGSTIVGEARFYGGGRPPGYEYRHFLFTTNIVPEPNSLYLAAMGVLGLLTRKNRTGDHLCPGRIAGSP